VAAGELAGEFGRFFDVLDLHAFRFDPGRAGGRRYLGWSCLVRKPGRLPARTGRGSGITETGAGGRHPGVVPVEEDGPCWKP
jgi:hypothetical protein